MGMHAGDKWELYIPSELAYGASGSPPKIGPDAPLRFEIELLSFPGDGLAKKGKKAKKGAGKKQKAAKAAATEEL
eukprot:NODE_6922_length_428_cov_53.060686_g5313_i0.p5 GENE.NODE_6922_length_428_cov_53.060686_g5313_i0~~NODE_6922_length_428_cov_53.060686_g5313_i0.p5  ORF type:complete len:85 (+),score=55.72 NODE_6922_length_428_cov_53.060686_g5313_i0:31-255(+)